MKETKEKKTVETSGKDASTLFFVLAALMVLYMGFSLFTSWDTFVSYCEAYNYNMSDQWVAGLSNILAAVVPCLVYASTLYGIGLLLKKSSK